MGIRHVVEAANVDADGFVIDPSAARHCVLLRGAVADLSGPVDPLTHLNSDFRHHALDGCVIAERLELGARVVTDGDGGLTLAFARPSGMARRGAVDIDARRIAWLDALRQRREGGVDADRRSGGR